MVRISGRAKGGHARAAALSPEERSLIAVKAAAARWAGHVKPTRPKQQDIVYIQRDLEAIKHTLDTILRPYKADVKMLRAENLALREGIARKERDVEALLRFLARRHPELVVDALSVLLDPSRKGWRKFQSNWRQRLGLEPE